MAPWRTSRASDGATKMSPESLARESYTRHGAELYRYALSRLGDDGLAQDAVQETIVRAWRAADRFDPAVAALRTWLYAILRHVIIDVANSRSKAPVLPPPVEATSQEDGGREMKDETAVVADVDLITRALRLISLDHRTAIVETYLRDRPYEEVAAELGVSVSTLRSRVFYGLKQLRHAMKMMVIEP